MNIGKNIMEFRKKEHLSQEQLAEKIGVSRQTISNWELEESYPVVNQLLKLAQIFNTSLDILAGSTMIYNIDDDYNKIIIVSKEENVIVSCNKVQSSEEFKGSNSSPKYALFFVNDNSKVFPNNTFLGWYKNKESITQEIEEISKAIIAKQLVYELKYNSKVKKKFLGLSIKCK